MNSEQVAAIERLRELEKKATPGEWWIEEHDGELYADPPNPSIDLVSGPDGDFVGVLDSDNDQQFVCALRNDGMPLIEALQQSLSEAQADARVFSGSYNALAVDFGRLKEELQETQDDKLYVDSESQMLINENNQLKAENERLKSEAERTDKAFSKTLKDLTFSKRESRIFLFCLF